MTVPELPVCFDCKHFNPDGWVCPAFPDGIPEEITVDGNKHKKPLPGQGNDVVFTKRNDA